VKDTKELLETKLELSDEQLENVGGGLNPYYWYYGYCLECGWTCHEAPGDKVLIPINEHRNQTGHRSIEALRV